MFLSKRIRSPVVGGIFYPDDEKGILSAFASMGLKPGEGGSSAALIAPHGAWEISGSAVAEAFSAASGRQPSWIVLLGPLHNVKEERLFLSDSRFFRTPLGDIQVEQEITGQLESRSTFFEINDIPHLGEHSLEVLLPFVKYCFPRAKIIPVLMGEPRPALISALAKGLGFVFAPIMDKTLLVISGNLSMGPDEDRARQHAEECAALLCEKAAGAFAANVSRGRFKLCGGGLMASLLESGLIDSMTGRLITRPLIKGRDEDGNTLFFGALSFE
jgi:AmmeMemoRadiSam system protein B